MAASNRDRVADLERRGVAPHEARWLVEEFLIGNDPDAQVILESAVARRLAGEPLQYILGHWPFRHLDLDVDPRVLIPRPETEELVDYALAAVAKSGIATPLIVDAGCGSGAIGLAILDELRDRGIAGSLVSLDASVEALRVAKINARKHHLLAVSFVTSHWFDELDPSLRGRVHLIVTNPPYVSTAEYHEADPIIHFEPREALVALDVEPGDGLADIAHLIDDSFQWLAPGGSLIIEHGFSQGVAMVQRAVARGYVDVVDHLDLAGHPRLLEARRP